MENQNTTPTIIERAQDLVTDGIEKVSSTASRAGHGIERVGKMREAGVDDEVIALQLTKNSTHDNEYTVSDVNAIGKFYADAQTKAPVTAAQSRALIKDARNQYGSELGEAIAEGSA